MKMKKEKKKKSQGPSLPLHFKQGLPEVGHVTYSNIHRAAHCPGRVSQHLVLAQEVNKRRLSDTCKCTQSDNSWEIAQGKVKKAQEPTGRSTN